MDASRILIAGGGIGGLTASLCLAKQGFDVAVFEQAPVLNEVGAGIQLSPNCTRVLHYLGLESELRAKAFIPHGTQFRHWRTGKVINESALGAEVVERYGMPYYHIHRADLLAILAQAAATTPGVTVYANSRVNGFDQNQEGVQLVTDAGTYNGSLLVGADGIHSVVREALWGEEKARFTGNVAWRLMVPRERLPDDLIRPMSTAWWGPGKHFVHYYVRSGTLVNCVCVVEKSGWEVESWTERGDIVELKTDFAGWHDDIRQLISNADDDTLYKWALYDRPPMPRWGQGRVSLLGDACHPALPFMAQGAAMAIEDGAVLASCLALDNNFSSALSNTRICDVIAPPAFKTGPVKMPGCSICPESQPGFATRAVRAAGQRARDSLFRYNALEVTNR